MTERVGSIEGPWVGWMAYTLSEMRCAKARIFMVVRRAEKSSKDAGGVKRRLLNICEEALLGVGLLVLELIPKNV